jgi:hypothetical protein
MIGFAKIAKPIGILRYFRVLVISIKFTPLHHPMNPPESDMFSTVPNPTSLAQLHDQAKREACRLRREASDDFWLGANAVWQRSVARLKAGFARHAHRSVNTTPTEA